MKLTILLPGYVESPDYRHLVAIDEKLTTLGYTVVRVDVCNLWQTGDGQNYSTTGYINQVKDIVTSYLPQKPTEIVLIGHSLGCLVALQIGNIFSEVTKIVCLSPPATLNNSDHKWVDGFRTSKKDLPTDPTAFTSFTVPFSFTLDRSKYSMTDSFNNNKKPLLTIIGSEDQASLGLENILTSLKPSKFMKIEGMGHDFRQSEVLCQRVAAEIVSFLNT